MTAGPLGCCFWLCASPVRWAAPCGVLIPAVFRAKWGTNETLFTLMMNYIAIGIVKYLQGGPWEKKPRGTQQIGLFKDAARMPTVWNITIGLFLIILLVFFHVLLLEIYQAGL